MKHIEVAAGILWRGGRCLAVSRPAGKPHAGRWEFPGGKLELGESPAQALRRELAEELGIRVREANFWRVVEHDYAEKQLHVRLHFFHVTAFDGEPAAKEEQNLCWALPQEAAQLDFLEADLPLVRDLAAMPAPSGMQHTGRQNTGRSIYGAAT